MLNYLMNQNYKNLTHSYIKQQKTKKNYLSTSYLPKKMNNSNIFSKTEFSSDSFLKTPTNIKKIKLTKKKSDIFINNDKSPLQNKFKINYKTTNNSPKFKKNIKRIASLKKIINKKNESINLSLKLESYKYKNHINKNNIKYNNSLTNIINITNNNIPTNFTSSVNNTVASTTNNNSNNLSQKSNNKSSEENKNNEVKIKIKILYRKKYFDIELNKFKNGLWLAKKINEYYKISLNEQQIDKLAQDLTNQINNIINCIINFPEIQDYGAIININKLLNKKTKFFINEQRYKTLMKYNNENYYFFINNNNDILDMTNIIINNIIKKDKYNISALKQEILNKVNNSFNKAYNKNFLKTDINEI